MPHTNFLHRALAATVAEDRFGLEMTISLA
jgi:hypothetical protein